MRPETVELGRAKRPGETLDSYKVTRWVAMGSGRYLHQIRHWRAIRDALDFRPVAELPAAKAKLRLLP